MNTNYTSIKSFADACEATGLNAKELEAQWAANGDTKDEIAYKKLKAFTKAINGDWTPRMGDGDQRKYYNYFWVNTAGSGFSFSNYGCDFNYSDVGSRLCFETAEQAQHAARYGEELYKEFYL